MLWPALEECAYRLAHLVKLIAWAATCVFRIKVEERVENESPRHERDAIDLQPLSHEVPNIDAAVAKIARYSAELTLPQGTIHVLSDIHGEDQKLRHVINNASGTLRPLVERLFQEHMTPERFREFLTLIFYPAEVVGRLERTLHSVEDQKAYAQSTLHELFAVVRLLADRRSLRQATRVFPSSTGNYLLRSCMRPPPIGTAITWRLSLTR